MMNKIRIMFRILLIFEGSLPHFLINFDFNYTLWEPAKAAFTIDLHTKSLSICYTNPLNNVDVYTGGRYLMHLQQVPMIFIIHTGL